MHAARHRGFDVYREACASGQSGRLAGARLTDGPGGRGGG